MNIRAALTASHAITDDPRGFAGKLLADQRQITETLKEMLETDSAYLLGFDVEEWETEANDLYETWRSMFERFR